MAHHPLSTPLPVLNPMLTHPSIFFFFLMMTHSSLFDSPLRNKNEKSTDPDSPKSRTQKKWQNYPRGWNTHFIPFLRNSPEFWYTFSSFNYIEPVLSFCCFGSSCRLYDMLMMQRSTLFTHAPRTSLPPPCSRSHFTPPCLAPQINQIISCGNAQYLTV
jgi:hypothetical protein